MDASGMLVTVKKQEDQTIKPDSIHIQWRRGIVLLVSHRPKTLKKETKGSSGGEKKLSPAHPWAGGEKSTCENFRQ